MFPTLHYHNQIAVITLNRPEALNALSFQILENLFSLLKEVKSSSARALIITGAGDKAFCAGADIKELMGRSRQEQLSGSEFGQAVFQAVEDLPLPSVALMNGFAFGGGLELALACTFRLATPNAKFGLPEIKLGLIPGYGGTQRLTRTIGLTKANELILTGKSIDAEQALGMGILNKIVPLENKLKDALEFCAQFTHYSLPVLGFAKTAILRSLDVGLYEGLKAESNLSTLAYSLSDAEEGMNAFLEKRKPIFKDN
jgi:enoyl-CoA hydratase